jgi:hypothetical protein
MVTALHERHGRTAQRAHQGDLVGDGRHARRRDAVGRMRADHERHRHALLALHVLCVKRAQIAWRDEIDARLVAPAQHHAPVSHVALRAVEAARDVDARRNVGAAVLAVLQMHR